MKIVIEIDEYDKEWIHNAYDIPNEIKSKIVDAIENGTPLPKGHGDLIDRQALIDNGIGKGFCNWYDEIKYANPVIEADKENE